MHDHRLKLALAAVAALLIGSVIIVARPRAREPMPPPVASDTVPLTPEQYCARARALNPNTRDDCEKTVEQERARSPRRFACRARCVDGAADIGQLGACVARCPGG